MSIPYPVRPTILAFTPFADSAHVNGNDYIDPGTHSDTWWRIHRLSPNELVFESTVGAGITIARTFTISLLPGVMYVAELRYKNETGWSNWSTPFVAKVADDVNAAAIAMPAEPQSGGTIPINPDFIADPAFTRRLFESRMETGHLRRRLEESAARGRVRMTWNNLSAADKDTVRTFLKDRRDAVESFATNDDAHGSREWFIVNGAIETILTEENDDDGVWTVAIDAIETFPGNRLFTVEQSAVAGDDPIA